MNLKIFLHKLSFITFIATSTWFIMFVMKEGVHENALLCASFIFGIRLLEVSKRLAKFENGDEWVVISHKGKPCPVCDKPREN